MPAVVIAFIVLFNVAVFAVVILAVTRARKSLAAGRAAVAQASDAWPRLAESLGAGVAGAGVGGEIQGKPYRLSHEAGTRKHAISFCLRVDHPFPDVIKLVKEGGFHRLAKRIGLEVEVESGDAAFDERFYVYADNAAYARAYLESRDHTARILELDDACRGHAETVDIRLHRRGLEVRLVNYRRGSLASEQVRGILGAMAALAAPVPDPIASHARPSNAFDVGQRVAWIAFAILGIVAGVVAVAYGNTYEPIENSIYGQALGSAGIAWLFFLALAFLLIRGRSWSGPIFLAVLLCSIPTFITGGIGAYTIRNGAGDAGAPTEHHTRVLSLYTTRSKNSTTRHVVVAPWRPEGKPPHFKIGRALYDCLQEGGAVTVVTKPGALGHEWLVEVRAATGAEATP